MLDSISVTLRPLHTTLFGVIEEAHRYFDIWFPVHKVEIAAFGETGDEVPKKRQDPAGSGEYAEWVEEGESMSKVRFCVILHERIRDHLPEDGRSLEFGVSTPLSNNPWPNICLLQFDLNLELTYTVEEEFMVESETISSTQQVETLSAKSSEVRKAASSQALQLRQVEKIFSLDTRVELGAASRSAEP